MLDVALLAVALNHDAVGDQVWLARSWSIWFKHLIEDQRRLRHIEASHAAVEQRVESDNVGGDVFVVLHLLEHGLVDFKGFFELVRLLVSLDHGCVDDCVHRDTILLHEVKDFASPLDVVTLDTCLQQAAIGHLAGHKACFLHLAEHAEGLLQLILLPIRLDYDAVGDCTWTQSRRFGLIALLSLCLVGRCSTLSKSPVALESAALGGTHVVSVHLVE